MEFEYNERQSEVQFNENAVYVILDTNVLIQNLSEIKEIIEKNELYSPELSSFFLIPWIVILELDALKTNQKDKLKLGRESREAINYLLKLSTEKCDYIHFQNSAQNDEILSEIKCISNDDYILKCALKSKLTRNFLLNFKNFIPRASFQF